MRLLPILLCALLLPLIGTTTALPAHAKGDPAHKKDAVGQLTIEELALLKRKLPNWDELESRTQQRIARHVLHLRKMDPAERQRFKDRMERMRGKQRREHPSVFMAAFGQAIESMLTDDWPEGLKLAKQKKWSRGRLVGLFLRKILMRRISEFEAQEALAEGFDVAAALEGEPEHKIRWFEGVLKKAREGDRKARHQVGRRLFYKRVHDLRSAGDVSAVTEQVRARWSKPYAQALEDVRNNESKIAKLFEAAARRGRGPVGAREWVQLAMKLDDVAGRSAKADPALAKEAGALFTRILRDHLKVPADQIEALPAVGDPKRKSALVRLIGSRMGRGKPGMAPGRGNGFRGRRGGMFGGKRGPNPKKDDDKKDDGK